MAEIFRATDGRVSVSDCLPPDFSSSSLLADRLLSSIGELFVVDRMSYREKMKDAVVYLLLKDEAQRPIFADLVATLAVFRSVDGAGRIRLGFFREPSTTALRKIWHGQPQIVQRKAWPDPVQDLVEADLDAGEAVLRTYHRLLLEHAAAKTLKRGGTSKPEARLCALMRRVFPDAGFAKTRPIWLMGEKGKPLELDIFSSSMRVAIEVQGPYHSRPLRGRDALIRQQARDAIKRDTCGREGIRLLLLDASAVNFELLTLPDDEQERLIRDLIERTTQERPLFWPDHLAAEMQSSQVTPSTTHLTSVS